MPYYALFLRHPQWNIGVPLDHVEGDEEGRVLEHELLKQTHLNMSRKFWAVANCNRVNQNVEVNSLVWVIAETLLPGATGKILTKWIGPYRVSEIIRDGSAYRLVNVFNQLEIQRAADKVKPYHGHEQWLTELQEVFVPEVPVQPCVCRPPPRLIEEM